MLHNSNLAYRIMYVFGKRTLRLNVLVNGKTLTPGAGHRIERFFVYTSFQLRCKPMKGEGVKRRGFPRVIAPL